MALKNNKSEVSPSSPFRCKGAPKSAHLSERHYLKTRLHVESRAGSKQYLGSFRQESKTNTCGSRIHSRLPSHLDIETAEFVLIVIICTYSEIAQSGNMRFATNC